MKSGAQFHLDVGEEVYSCSMQCDEEAKNLELMVEDVDFNKLPQAYEVDKLHRSPVANNFVGRELTTEYLLLFGDAFIKVVGKHDKKTNTTSLVCGKRKDVRKGIKLLHREKIALCLVIPEYQVKLSLRLNEDGTEFELFVNGRTIYALPYVYGKSLKLFLAFIEHALIQKLLLLVLDPDQDQDAKIILAVDVIVNDETIVVPNPWSQVDFVQNIHAALGQDKDYLKVPVKDAAIEGPECENPGPLNEVIDAVVEMSHPRHGLLSIDFSRFPPDAKFDAHLLRRL